MKKIINKKNFVYFLLITILCLGFFLRLYKIDRPIADWHSWRQADTAAVSRNFVKHGFTIFTPRFDDLSPLAENDLPNPNGYRYVEFPLYNIFVGIVWLFFPFQESYARLVSIFISLGSITLLFLLVRRFLGDLGALISAFVFAFLPFNIFFSTVILPEPLLIFSMIGSLLFFDIWLEEKNNFARGIIFGFFAVLFSAITLLTKPTGIFIIFPLLYLSYFRLGLSFWKSAKVWILVILSVAPFLAWRFITLQHPEGIPRFVWLFNGNNIRFKGAFFYWIIQDRLNRLILSGAGFALFILGLLHTSKREGLFFYSWLFGMILYVVVFATGNVNHDYYQIPLIPILSVFVAKGILMLISQKTLLKKIFYTFLAVFLVGLMFGLSWKEVRPFFEINNPKIIEVGRLADGLLPKEAKVIAPYGGDTAFLYQTNRQGWPVVFLPIPEIIKQGAQYYITVTMNSEANDLLSQYEPVVSTKEYAIIDLTKKKSQ